MKYENIKYVYNVMCIMLIKNIYTDILDIHILKIFISTYIYIIFYYFNRF